MWFSGISAADEPNQVYVGDITYLPVAGGKNMYLATVIDCYSRHLTGFALADHMRTSFSARSHMDMAKRHRGGSLKTAVFHSDHGSVYTSQAFQTYCSLHGIQQSMGAVGTSGR